MYVLKRNKIPEEFNRLKVEKAIIGALKDLNKSDENTIKIAKRIAYDIEKEYLDKQEKLNKEIMEISMLEIPIQEIEDRVEEKLMASSMKDVARQYIRFRYKKEMTRELNDKMFQRNKNVLDLIDGTNEYLATENSNKDATVLSTQRDYMAGEVSKEINEQFLIEPEVWDAHQKGIIHVHDTDFTSMKIHNCDLLNIEDMLTNGTKLSGVYIAPSKSLRTAATVMTQIMMQCAANQYGGQTVSISHLAPFVELSKNKYLKKYKDRGFSKELCQQYAQEDLNTEIKDSIQTILHQLVTYSGVQGQSPFCSIFLYISENKKYEKETAMLIEEMLKQRAAGLPGKDGHPITVAFPKLLYVLDENNIHEDSEYYYLTVLAAECSAKRLVPDYISAKQMRKLKEGNVYPCMGCRSFLQPYYEPETGKPKFYGRFNMGVATISLPHAALSSNKDIKKFWQLMESRTELCHKALLSRFKRLKGTPSDVAPILWQDGALARLKPGETIDKLLYNDYCSISLGYAGLYECVKYMTGYSHTEPGGKEFALEIMNFLNDKCNQWKNDEHIGYSLYGTPIESTTYKFAKALKRDFGEIEGITNYNYITNSYHVNVREEIDAFTKLKFESEFQNLSLGGAISYIEVPNMQKNIPALITILRYIYENIMYAEINTKSDYCYDCQYDGEMLLDENLEWFCPNCGNKNFNNMSIARRVCGYISTSPMNYGRKQEISERVLHL